MALLPRGRRILFRGDSGFFVGALLELLDEGGHGYLIKVKLKELVKLLSGGGLCSIDTASIDFLIFPL